MAEIFVRHHDFAEQCVDRLRPVVGQASALFLLDGRVVGFDLFDRGITLRRLLPKLVRSVAMDEVGLGGSPGPDRDGTPSRRPDLQVGRSPACGPDPKTRRPGLEAGRVSPDLLTKVAEHFLERTCAAAVHSDEALGMRRDLRLLPPTISGAALEVDG